LWARKQVVKFHNQLQSKAIKQVGSYLQFCRN